jgi:prepilin-type N-terminal cleavage/methylation domain-containing protein
MNKKYFLLRSFPSSSLGMQSWKLQLPVPYGFPEAGASGNRVSKLELGNQRSNGFTLVEMTVVLLLITLLASVAVRETAELGFQTRYEQTKERLDMIKQAILGNPKQVINGQQAVSGFVADMGRLPMSVRELIDISAGSTGYCGNKTYVNQTICESNGSVWFSFCSNSTYSNQQACETNNALWMGRKSFGFCSDALYQNNQTQCLANGKKWAHLFYGGWNGPYLSISENPAEPDALTDGWGNQSTLATDQSYGWQFFQLDALTGNTQDSGNLIVQSFGKNQQKDNAIPTNTDYENDFPPNLNLFGTVYFPNPAVLRQDWLVDISGGIKTNIKLSARDTRQIPPVSFCTDSTKTTKDTCTLPNVWFGGCDNQAYYNKESCVNPANPAPTKKWYSCSINTLDVDDSNYSSCSLPNICLKTKLDCETAGAVWYGEGFGCEDQTKTTKTDCELATKQWRSCTGGTEFCLDGNYSNKTTCEAAGKTWQALTPSTCAFNKELWYGENLIITGDNGGCSDIHYTNKASCEAATQTWNACSIVSATTFLGCEALGGHWLGNGYGCSDQQYNSQAACEANNKIWVESWPRCKKTAAPNTEPLVPYHNIKTSKDECEGVSGSWKYPRRQVCLNVFYRNNGNLSVATSLPILIEEDGAYQTMQFNGFYLPDLNDIDSDGDRYESLGSVLAVPTGQNAIGIYEYDGDCDPVNNPLYPADRQNPIQLDSQSHATLPVINW